MKLYDQNGNECQMTGLPHMFYDKVPVDERIAELERELDVRKASVAAQFRLIERVKELEKALREAIKWNWGTHAPDAAVESQVNKALGL